MAPSHIIQEVSVRGNLVDIFDTALPIRQPPGQDGSRTPGRERNGRAMEAITGLVQGRPGALPAWRTIPFPSCKKDDIPETPVADQWSQDYAAETGHSERR